MWWEALCKTWVVWLQVSSIHRSLNRLKRWDAQALVSLSGQTPVLPKLEINKFFVFILSIQSKSVWFPTHGVLEMEASVTTGCLYHEWKTGLCCHCHDSCHVGAHRLRVGDRDVILTEMSVLGQTLCEKRQRTNSKLERTWGRGRYLSRTFPMACEMHLKLVEAKGSNLLI